MDYPADAACPGYGKQSVAACGPFHNGPYRKLAAGFTRAGTVRLPDRCIARRMRSGSGPEAPMANEEHVALLLKGTEALERMASGKP